MLDIGPLQMEALSHLWKDGAQTVADVHARLNDSRSAAGAPPLAYTTTLTVLRNLARRKLVEQTHVPGKRGHVFTPVIDKDQFRQQLISSFVDAVFDGDKEELKKLL